MRELSREVHREVGAAAEVAVFGEGLECLLPGDDDDGAMPVKLLVQFARGSQRVVFGHAGPQGQRGIEGDDVLGAVGHDERHHVAFSHATPIERRGGLAGLMRQLRVSDGASEEVDGDAVGISRC